MKRPSTTVIAVLAVVALAVGAMVWRLGAPREATPGVAVTNDARAFISDSLAMRVRVPDTGWTLRREGASRSDGRVVVAANQDSTGYVSVFVLPAGPETTLDGLLAARKKQVAAVFGVDDLDKVIAKTIRDETKEIAGHTFRQWQAVSQPADEPGAAPRIIMFMWVLTVTPQRSYECIGLIRYPAQTTPEERQRLEGTLRDLAYVLQSFELL